MNIISYVIRIKIIKVGLLVNHSTKSNFYSNIYIYYYIILHKTPSVFLLIK
jgi:hypothetical protein